MNETKNAALGAAATVRRVQRPTTEFPVLHLEAEIPSCDRVAIGGLTESPASFSLDDLQTMPTEVRRWDLHCVWGWSRPSCQWEGVVVEELLKQTCPLPEARYAVVSAAGHQYASCLALDELRESLIALRLDAEPLAPEHGGPMRLVPPPRKWGYKGVKWVGEITLVNRFTPGMWESLVGDPVGDVPIERLDLGGE